MKPVRSHVSKFKKLCFFIFSLSLSFHVVVLTKTNTGREFLADRRQNQVSEHLRYFFSSFLCESVVLDRFFVVELNAVQNRLSFKKWEGLRLYFLCLSSLLLAAVELSCAFGIHPRF